MQRKTRREAGFTLVEIMIVVAIIGLLAAIAIPNFIRARIKSQQNACINNLRQIDGAKQQWALETKQAPAATPIIDDITPYLGRGTGGSSSSIVCPLDTDSAFGSSYQINVLSTTPTCLQDGTSHVLVD